MNEELMMSVVETVRNMFDIPANDHLSIEELVTIASHGRLTQEEEERVNNYIENGSFYFDEEYLNDLDDDITLEELLPEWWEDDGHYDDDPNVYHGDYSEE